MSFNGNAFHGTNRRICDLLGRAERSFALAEKEAKTANPPSKLGTCLRYLSRYFKKIYEELFAPLKVSAGALPLRFATPGYFSNVNRLISV